MGTVLLVRITAFLDELFGVFRHNPSRRFGHHLYPIHHHRCQSLRIPVFPKLNHHHPYRNVFSPPIIATATPHREISGREPTPMRVPPPFAFGARAPVDPRSPAVARAGSRVGEREIYMCGNVKKMSQRIFGLGKTRKEA